MRTDYRLSNGATAGDFLTALNTAFSLEDSYEAFLILTAMRELLYAIGDDNPRDEADGPEVRIKRLEDSLVALFLQWFGLTGLKVQGFDSKTATLEDVFNVLFGASAMVEP